ncbi:MAG: DUF6491 family protein [Gammaproteobacteria bacterium]|nr:DUF6491 family protein [Gammaproteobacteria bacterium]MDP2139409.1 DUF6491 family protein [Gammaproteobacteria bacterium]MDP2346245.1 DUF6491 family protein [Gammaproteobacteria bacterium]
MNIRILMLATGLLVLAACQASTPNAVQRGTPGEQVSSICFNRQIDNWQPLSRNAIILERGLNDYYRVILDGGCDARRSGLSIVTESRTGICLEEGDEIDFEGDFSPSCRINQINAWIPAIE